MVTTATTATPSTDKMVMAAAGTQPPTTSTDNMVQAAAGTGSSYDWDAYQKKLAETVAQTNQVYGSPYQGGFEGATDVKTSLGSEAIKSYNAEYEALKQQAQQSSTALELVGQSTQLGIQSIEALQQQVNSGYQSTLDSFNLAAEKADEYVQASRARVGEVLSKLDEINQQIIGDRDFAKANALQVAVQSTLDSMKAEGRNIMEQYGAQSPEYQQFQMGKQRTLAVAQSNIQATYQQFAEQHALTYMTATNEALWKQNMYTSFQEQQHVEMLKYVAEAKAGYEMQFAQFNLGVEQLKMSGMENLANWIVNTPTFTMDSTPLVTLLAELSEKEIIGYEPTWDTQSAGGRPSVGGKQSGGATTSRYVDKPVYA
jgi:hypothetical protein